MALVYREFMLRLEIEMQHSTKDNNDNDNDNDNDRNNRSIKEYQLDNYYEQHAACEGVNE
jgi:hypothetical protein